MSDRARLGAVSRWLAGVGSPLPPQLMLAARNPTAKEREMHSLIQIDLARALVVEKPKEVSERQALRETRRLRWPQRRLRLRASWRTAAFRPKHAAEIL